MCLFKCGKPKLSKFIFLFTLFLFIRKAILIILKKYCSFEGTLITAWLMFGGELFIGLFNILVEYKRLLNFKIDKFIGIPIIDNKTQSLHSKCSIVLLFFLCSILDFLYYFFLNYNVTQNYNKIFHFLDVKLSPFQLLFTSIMCLFIISQKIYLIQCFSLFVVIIGLAGIISFEFLFRKNINNMDEIKMLVFIIGSNLFLSLQYYIEKILMTYDNSTPFQILFYEGLFGNIIMIVVPFLEIENKFPDKGKKDKIWMLILGFVLYFLSSCFLNIYKLTVILLSSPTNVATCHSFSIPFILTLSYIMNKNEIENLENKNMYIGINFALIALIILGCLFYNEIILFSCQKEKLDYINRNRSNNIKINDSFNSGMQRMDGSFTTEGEESY